MGHEPDQHHSARPRWRPTARVVLYLVLYFVLSAIAQLAVVLLLSSVGLQLPPFGELLSSPLVLPVYLSIVLVVVGLTAGMAGALDRRSLAEFGLSPRGPWRRDLALGFLLGAGLMSLILLAQLAAGWYRFRAFAWQAQPLPDVLLALLVTFGLFVMVAFVEEVGFRGYVQQNLAADWGPASGLVASAVVFAGFHATNANAGIIPVLALVVAGLLLGAGYLVTRALWLPIGLHLSWNWFQGPVFGFPVSGNPSGGLLRLEAVGPEVLTGGGFGPEASVVGVAAEVLGVALLWWLARRAAEGAGPTGSSR